MSDDVIKAAAFYVNVCIEHQRLFPLRNIVVVADGSQNTEEADRFIADVVTVLDRYRLGEGIDGMDRTLRADFGELR
ncbi:hypothetical protein GAO09_08575 [Rhizobiales bacterium RZME27]|uniref:Uncharacterized protein n=1 Tax=Endobacterium cereale TaxID=2663029 RepID=A0A6A8A5F2_9HYPH|nr:hypothetical protein [Endobacterium cereale]MQY46109.1 hypothetical protein [Endobacterium cereale]